MTDAPVNIQIAPAGSVHALDLWDDFVPDFGLLAAFKVEPRRWWVIADDLAAAPLRNTVATHGTLTPIGGGLMCAALTGSGWRELLMIGGWFDAESPSFAVGDCAGTVIGHVSVWLHVVAAGQCNVYFAASYRTAMEQHWRHVLEATP